MSTLLRSRKKISSPLTKRIRRPLRTKRSRIRRRIRKLAVVIPIQEQPLYKQGYDSGYKDGLGAADTQGPEGIYDRGYNRGYDEGFDNGYHSGGDGIIDALLAEYEILPECSSREVIAAGMEALRPRIMRLLTAEELGERMLEALNDNRPMSIVRLGDGELLTLAQESVMPVEKVREEGKFLAYAGVHVPDLAARDRLLEAVRSATIVGIPKLRLRNYQPLALSVFRTYGIDYRSLTLTDSLVNYYLYQAGYLSRITRGRRVLIVGNLANELGEILVTNGVHVVGMVTPVNGMGDINRVMEIVAHHEFDLALVSAGISAVCIVQRIASEMGKVAIDFGHLADSMVKGEAPFQ